MSRVSRTYFPSGFIATLATRTSNDNVRAQDTNIVIGQDAAKSMSSSALNNIVIGNDSAPALSSGNGNIYIGDEMGHTANENNVLRIGNRGIQSSDLIVGTMSSTLEDQKVTINGYAVITDTGAASSHTDPDASIHTDGGVSITKNCYIGTGLNVNSGGINIVTGGITVTSGAASFNDNVTLGSTSTDEINVNGELIIWNNAEIGSNAIDSLLVRAHSNFNARASFGDDVTISGDLNIKEAAPSTLENGDIWINGGDFYYRTGNTTYVLNGTAL